MAATIGLAIAVSAIHEGPFIAVALRAVGYPTACAAIVRWVPIVRHRRVDWLVAHELGMTAICVGWALVPQWSAVAINGAWGATALVWWAVGGARRTER